MGNKGRDDSSSMEVTVHLSETAQETFSLDLDHGSVSITIGGKTVNISGSAFAHTDEGGCLEVVSTDDETTIDAIQFDSIDQATLEVR